jgi:hypothetical protein
MVEIKAEAIAGLLEKARRSKDPLITVATAETRTCDSVTGSNPNYMLDSNHTNTSIFTEAKAMSTKTCAVFNRVGYSYEHDLLNSHSLLSDSEEIYYVR